MTPLQPPLNYARFLDYCAARIFLRKVGGGYIFTHRLLLEHFAALTEEDIKRLAGSNKDRYLYPARPMPDQATKSRG